MRLANAPDRYDQADQARLRGELERSDAENLKKGADIQLAPFQRLVIQDEVSGQLYRLKVASGVLSLVAYP